MDTHERLDLDTRLGIAMSEKEIEGTWAKADLIYSKGDERHLDFLYISLTRINRTDKHRIAEKFATLQAKAKRKEKNLISASNEATCI
jgi:hypothetical protein